MHPCLELEQDWTKKSSENTNGKATEKLNSWHRRWLEGSNAWIWQFKPRVMAKVGILWAFGLRTDGSGSLHTSLTCTTLWPQLDSSILWAFKRLTSYWTKLSFHASSLHQNTFRRSLRWKKKVLPSQLNFWFRLTNLHQIRSKTVILSESNYTALST